MKLPRIMLAAPSSGSGKTLVTCGLLQALHNRSLQVSAFKCGPDYIDPMFHTRVIGVPSRNLDTFFADGDTVRYLFAKHAEKSDLSVIEGVMGFYDGVAGITAEASSWDLADETDTPVILVVNAKGMSLSVAAQIQGFLSVPAMIKKAGRKDSHIRGVILNQTSPMLYPELKKLIEEALPVKVLGYVPRLEAGVIESRHLGLVLPDEMADLKERLNRLAAVMEETVDLDALIGMAKDAGELEISIPEGLQKLEKREEANPRIAVARDEAFCFYYEDNLDLLRELGAELVFFSPLHDRKLPDGIQGILIGGGYPELYAGQLSGNITMRQSVREAIAAKIPCIAECGGFMYLHETMEDMENKSWPMVGSIPEHVHRTDRLGRFGYITLTANKAQLYGKQGSQIKGHEFHYFDSSGNGSAFHAEKPHRKRSWDCIAADDSLAAGFPHLYYYSNPEYAAEFVRRCEEYKHRERQSKA